MDSKLRQTTAEPPRATRDNDALRAFDRGAQRRSKRDAVLRAAASAFIREGFANTSMDDVAKSLRISKPTLYQYFPSKEDILYACHELSMCHAEAGLALARETGGSGLDKLLTFLRRYMGGMLGEFGNCPVLTNVDNLSPARRGEVVNRRAKISAAARRFINEGVRDGSVRACPPRLAALFTLGAVNYIPLWYRDSGPNTPEEIVESFVEFLRASIAATAPRAARRDRGAPRRSTA